MDKRKYLASRLHVEMHHGQIYEELAQKENNPKRRSYLSSLTKLESDHAKILSGVSDAKWNEDDAWERLYTWGIIFLSKIAGLAFAIKYMEYGEENLDRKFFASGGKKTLSKKEKAALDEIERQEAKYERVLQNQIVETDAVLANIKDVAYGMNDGLVELLGVVAGLAVAISNPVIVLLGGFIVAVSGTLSMGGGAYLSTQYEKTVGAENKSRTVPVSAKSSAFYAGFMYFIGTLFPLAPFVFGMTGVPAIIAAIIATAIALTVVSGMIAIIGGVSLYKRVGETLLISLGIAVITIIIGTVARTVLHIPA